MSTTWREGRVAAVLIGATVLLAAGMGLTGTASWLESASFVTGAACVWLTVRENVWNFPIGLVNVATFGFVFLHARLYADAGLQIVYLILRPGPVSLAPPWSGRHSAPRHAGRA